MSTRRKDRRYSDERLGEIQVVKDFLPAPSELATRKTRSKLPSG